MRGGGTAYRDRIVGRGDNWAEGWRWKGGCVRGERERGMKLLGFGWKDAVTTQVYTVQNIGQLVGERRAAWGAVVRGWRQGRR